MDLPRYITTGDQENYHEELNQTLCDGLSNNGWTVPNLTTTQITSLNTSMPLGTIWFNTNLAKLQVLTAAGTVETITSA